MATRNLTLRRTDAKVVPWKNGLGTTSELAIWPVGTSMDRLDFDWRISAARVGAAGPFSEFRGFDRILTVASGAGLRVGHGGHAVGAELRPLEPYRFAGDWPTVAELLGGPVTDFNVIFRRGKVRAEVEAIRLESRTEHRAASCTHMFLHVVSGSLRLAVTGSEHVADLDAGDSFWRQGAESTELHFEPVPRASRSAVLLASLR